ncbi:putative pkinase-domain-containing protein [Lyophyllum shimeji]|uniref:non-specific serine/threonine protein kinase n=1 Tax=Lyophyllum shimeji TaxID=47721 RepID=A0A9P3UNN3_LYOSH|nr:putative pkinase-domain-containing protein [Lyophyllum shimeji]
MADGGYSMIPRRHAAGEPRRIGLWKIGRQIGAGASGRVKIARHSKTGQYAAIKIISKVMLNSRVSVNRVADETEHRQLAIEREIVVMKLLDHPNVMRLYDVWETSTELYLVLEYIQGGELFEHLCKKGKLPVPEALNYFQQIISAVDYCHRFNIVHRDLKPENILLDKDFNIKIADFGMAAWQADTERLLRTSCGSPHYAAPEIIFGDMYNGMAVDIWSCGVILFALLVGKLPFDDDDCVAVLNKVKAGEYELPSDLDPMAQDLISRMLVKDASHRISMCDIMTHPFFTLYPPKTNPPAIPNLVSATKSIGDTSLIDPDIFANLRTLWHGTRDEEIVESLTNDEPMLQKAIYHLLAQYRAKHMELFRDEEQLIAEDRLERKRSRKAKAALKAALDNVEIEPSPSIIPPREDPPTPRKALGQRSASTGLSDWSLCRGPFPTIELQSPSPIASPLAVHCNWQPLPALTVPELEDETMQAFFHQIVQHLNALQAKASGSEYGWSPNLGLEDDPSDGSRIGTSAPPPTPAEKTTVNVYQDQERPSHAETFGVALGGGTRPLSVKRKPRRPHSTAIVDSSNKENIGEEDFLAIDEGGNIRKMFSLKRGKEHRARLGEKRVHIVEPQTKERSKLVKRRSIKGSVSPAISDSSVVCSPAPFTLPPFSSSPKRTWLGNVFSVRPPPLTLLSVADVQTTRNECRRLLMAMDIRVVLEDPENLGLLKCRLEEVREPTGLINTMKAVKFRVELQKPRLLEQEDEAALMMSLTVFYEKGSTQTFREVCRRLQEGWTLDETSTRRSGPGPGQFVLRLPS